MLSKSKPVFCNPHTNASKPIDRIRVEGPSHDIIQYRWTEWHVTQKKIATIVTTRSSGSSYLNRVELQTGCLSLGHSNTFIPSTLAGSCIDNETGTINSVKLKENVGLAINAYISHVDGCPCGEFHSITPDLEVFLKGSKKTNIWLTTCIHLSAVTK